MKVEVAVLGSPSLISLMVSVARRDQEEGGGAGPSREPRNWEVELGLRVGLDFCFGRSPTAVLRTLSL